MFKRSVVSFPLGVNIYSWLSSCKFGTWEGKVKGKYYYLDLIHCTTVDRLESDREGDMKKVFFKDRFFMSYDGNDPEDNPTIRNLNLILVTLGLNKVDVDCLPKTFLKRVKAELESFKGNYYVKTVMKLQSKKKYLFLNRGNYPYISLKDNLRYKNDEDRFNSFVIWNGKNKLKELKDKNDKS